MLKIISIFIVVAIHCLFLSVNAQEHVSLYKKEWKSCSNNEVNSNECVTVMGLCNKWVSVNKKYKDEIENVKNKYANFIFCGILPDAQGVIPFAECKDNKCVFADSEDKGTLY